MSGVEKPQTTRRTFLKGAAAVGAGVAGAQFIPGVGPATGAPRVRTDRSEQRAIVIGSGFGGGVAALRLAQAGVNVLVLERGRRWPTGPNARTFPTAKTMDRRVMWHKSAPNLFGRPFGTDPYVGLFETVVSPTMSAVCAAGVGGGSLVYLGMTLQPKRSVFNAWFPDALDYSTMDRVHYPRVARMLKANVAPDALINSHAYRGAREFAKRARRAGMPVEKLAAPIDWNYAIAENHGRMRRSYTIGDTLFGVNNGGKHSIDATYLRQAEATGRVTVATQHEVTSIARGRDGKWIVNVSRTDKFGRVVGRKVYTTKALILAAGSLNTSKLLVKAKRTGAISNLPDGVGHGWGTNGDRTFSWTGITADLGVPQGGPVVYGSQNWANPRTAYTIVQAAAPQFMGVDGRSTMLFGYGASGTRGSIGVDPLTGNPTIAWPFGGDAGVAGRLNNAAHRIGGIDPVADLNLVTPFTWHPLGGANMGVVCDLEGRVRGQKGLYVLDGSLLPGTAAACNPSMTIAAVAERALDDIVAKDVGSII